MASTSEISANAATSTIESKANFFRGVRGGQVTATARSLHIGRRTIVVHTEIRDDAGKSVTGHPYASRAEGGLGNR